MSVLLMPQLASLAPQLTCGNGRIRDDRGPRRVREHPRGVADAWRSADMTQVTPACSRPTKNYPDGRTGTSAGYQAHRGAGETPCDECRAGFSAQSIARRRSLPPEELERYRQRNAEASRRRRAEDPEGTRATKHRTLARNRGAVQKAKDKPCADCGIRYPYYVMEFDHLDSEAKEFNISAGVTRASHERLLVEIAKCEVVCANCHAERTHQRREQRRRSHAEQA